MSFCFTIVFFFFFFWTFSVCLFVCFCLSIYFSLWLSLCFIVCLTDCSFCLQSVWFVLFCLLLLVWPYLSLCFIVCLFDRLQFLSSSLTCSVPFWYFTRTASSIDACMGKTIFTPSTEAYFNHAVITARRLFCVGLIKTNQCTVVASEPMAMQPAIARQNGRGVWLYNQLPCHRCSYFFSSTTNSILRWLFADAGIRHWNASSSLIRTSRSDQLAHSVIPCSHTASIKRASVKEQISQRCCKYRTVIVRSAGLPCTRMTLTLSVCHAWGNPTLTLCSAGLTALIVRVSFLPLCAHG